MTNPDKTLADPMYAGQIALSNGAWREARACFESALLNEETPEALDGLGMAGWGLSDPALTFDARERAYRLYRQRVLPPASRWTISSTKARTSSQAAAFLPEFDWQDEVLRSGLIETVSREIEPTLSSYRDGEGIPFPVAWHFVTARKNRVY